MKTLEIIWQRLIHEEKTCPRCGSTEDEVEKAVASLKKSLDPLGINVVLKKREISIDAFKKDPLLSNMIWINGRILEDYIGGTTGQSQCCDVCGPNDCRTVGVDGNEYEVIPSELVIKAGLIAASQLLGTKTDNVDIQKGEYKMKIEIYDPAMCCPTGVCGPSADPELVRIQETLRQIQKQAPEVQVSRYGLTANPQAFVSNSAVAELLKDEGPQCLPLVFIDCDLVSKGSYPSNGQLQAILNRADIEITLGELKKASCGCKSGCC